MLNYALCAKCRVRYLGDGKRDMRRKGWSGVPSVDERRLDEAMTRDLMLTEMLSLCLGMVEVED